jgi:hypothetical protein
MNFWGFPVKVLEPFKQYLNDFIASSGAELKSECYLPKAADWLIKNDLCSFRALPGGEEWFGVTYREDKIHAIERLRELTEAGVYPEKLWA